MKREEQIKTQADIYTDDSSNYVVYQLCSGILVDDIGLIERAFKEGAKWADKTVIDKICDWLQNIDFEVEYFTTDSDGYTFFNADKFIENFRKAMEE